MVAHSKPLKESQKIPKSFSQQSKPKLTWSKKNTISQDKIMLSQKYLYDCENCKHEVEISPSRIKEGRSCYYCYRSRIGKRFCKDLDCDYCFQKSFASTIYYKESWSPNNKVQARFISKKSTLKCLFICKTCNHEFEKALCNVGNQICPYCNPQKLCEDKDCTFCFEKSFATAVESLVDIIWSPDNNISPRSLHRNSTRKCKFQCLKCPHQFEATLGNIQYNKGCPYCCFPPRKLCKDENCEPCLQKSFKSHPRSKYLSKDNTITARELFRNSHIKCKFDCDVCNNEFETTPACISHMNQWCPGCKKKSERIVNNFLKETYPSNNIKTQIRFQWCRNHRTLPFDFMLQDFSIIIELDGIQHFEQVSNWKSPECRQNIDTFKMTCAIKQGISIIRILQEDVFLNKYDWKNELTHTIEYLRTVSEPKIIYMCKKNEYDVYIEKMKNLQDKE
jgi:very-short-patch-repair endonuclease